MQRTSARLQIGVVVLVLLLLGAFAVAAHQVYVVRPERRCIEEGGWWDGPKLTCTVTITDFAEGPPGAARLAPAPRAATPPASPPAATARP